ncbi:FAD-dependent oxidoreductase [Phenylobacterium sp.]|jgi:monoamine oxidase|uniref:flavin monoamine oxidase family protein n=1 Tax=Phenylobacterium sp. TaxID=1871053 RepID=UPI0025E3E2D4|nr:FAD-dependent oxidoreductase [Phenylobacterium sp.]MCA3740167.1 FAD-dependent oxidoreductase [Phenylobacterium sp.]
MIQQQTDVIIVGGGFAGLSAARALRAMGARPIVLEGRGRAGGRAQTTELAGARLEMGAQWIGPGQPEIRKLASEFGFEIRPRPIGGVDWIYGRSAADGLPEDILKLSDLDPAETEIVVRRLDSIASTIDLELPANDDRSKAFDKETVAGWCARELSSSATAVVDQICEGFLGLPEQVSFLHALFYARANGGFASLLGLGGVRHDSEVLPQGLGTLAEQVAFDLRSAVRLGDPVERIVASENEVSARTSSGATFRAQSVIVALPPAVAAGIVFEPELPPRRLCVQRRYIPFSRLKFHVVYQTPFWRDAGFSGNVSGPNFSTFDGTASDDNAVIVGFFGAREALDIWRWPKRDRARLAIDRLETILGARAKSAMHYEDRFWLDEPFSHGCVAAPGPGVWTNFGSALREPVGRIIWAGSETALSMPGQIEGAIQSGKSAADSALCVIGVRR